MFPNTSNTAHGGDPRPHVLSALRALLPKRRLHLAEALRIAEIQANRFRDLRDYRDVPVPIEIVSELPRVAVEHDAQLPRQAVSGASYWDGARRSWIIALNPNEPRTRQRFSALHEYKHIIDHGHPGIVPSTDRFAGGSPPAEQVADFFAGCVLVPTRLLVAAHYDGVQRVAELAELFDVSKRAIEVRLAQTELVGNCSDSPASASYRYKRTTRRPWLASGVGS